MTTWLWVQLWIFVAIFLGASLVYLFNWWNPGFPLTSKGLASVAFELFGGGIFSILSLVEGLLYLVSHIGNTSSIHVITFFIIPILFLGYLTVRIQLNKRERKAIGAK